MKWFFDIFSPEGFAARIACGERWCTWRVVEHVVSDYLILFSYVCIPVMLAKWARNPFRPTDGTIVLWLGFILTCGLTHLTNALMFTWPAYDLDGHVRGLCALFSVAAVLSTGLEVRRRK